MEIKTTFKDWLSCLFKQLATGNMMVIVVNDKDQEHKGRVIGYSEQYSDVCNLLKKYKNYEG